VQRMNRKGSRQNTDMKQCGYAALFLLCLLLFGCTGNVDTTEIQRAEPSPETSLSFMGEPMPDLAELAQQKHLKHLDLRGHTIDLAQIEALQKALPDCEILYSVMIGGNAYACTAETLEIPNLTEEDLPLLSHFPDLTLLDARGSDCIEALKAYAEEHAEITVRWSVPIGSARIDHDAVWVDLSFAELPETDALIEAICSLEDATDVSLVGCMISRADQAKLLGMFPNLRLYWTVDVDGKQFRNTETRLDFNTVNFDGADELAEVVACFQDPQWVDVATHGFESAEMVELSNQFPNTEFVWTVDIGSQTVRTDIEVFYGANSPRHLRDEDIEPLQYCKNLKAINLYRNSLSDLSPLAELSQLEVLVISRNKVKDLSPLKTLKNLKYLEAHNNYIADLTPLISLPELRDVNLMFNDIRDFTPLTEIKQLERVYISRNEGTEDITRDQKLYSALPNAQIDMDDSNTRGWENHDRYDLLDRIWTSQQMEPLF